MRECSRCHDLQPESATMCECGEALAPLASTQHPTPLAPIPSCTCGNTTGDPNQGICTVCVLASYEPVAR